MTAPTPPDGPWIVFRGYGVLGTAGEHLWCYDEDQMQCGETAERVAAALNDAARLEARAVAAETALAAARTDNERLRTALHTVVVVALDGAAAEPTTTAVKR